jgi:PKD repeat protein
MSPRTIPLSQAGIDAAQDGDTVLVAPGTYVDPIDNLGKGITVASSAGPEVTTIDSNWQWMVIIESSDDLNQFTLQGFTLRAGISLLSASPTISGNIFDGTGSTGSNSLAILGGSGTVPVIEKNIFRNFNCNDDFYKGVILFECLTFETLIIRNNLFLNNNACGTVALSRCGMDNQGSPQVTNNTIVGNGAGFSIDMSNYSTYVGQALFENNIIVGNNKGLEVQNGALPSNITWQNNLVYGNSTNYSGVPDLTGINGNISADPLFLDPANNDFHLCLGSPAIDAGSTTGLVLPDTDFDGNPRVINGNMDIGAYEFDPNAPPRVSFEPDKVSGASPLSVQFTSFTTTNVTEYLWDFGNGTSSTEANPLHSFTPGIYTVSLSVIAPSGAAATATRSDLIESYIGYTITASAGAGGVMTPAGATTLREGSSLTYTATPNPGYQLIELIVDGQTVEGSSVYPLSYTFNNILSDHTVTAVFGSYHD